MDGVGVLRHSKLYFDLAGILALIDYLAEMYFKRLRNKKIKNEKE